MKVPAFKCKNCSDVVFSRATHDFRTCSCGEIFIDGGFEYVRVGGNGDLIEIEINETKKELYDDWNFNRDKYGIIRHGEENV